MTDLGRPSKQGAWVRGEIKTSEARAAATAHTVAHAPHAADYAVKAVAQAAVPTDSAAAGARERDWNTGLPEHLRPVAAALDKD